MIKIFDFLNLEEVWLMQRCRTPGPGKILPEARTSLKLSRCMRSIRLITKGPQSGVFEQADNNLFRREF